MSTYLIMLDGAGPKPEVSETLAGILERDEGARFGLVIPARRRKKATDGECWLEAAQFASSALEALREEGLPVLDAVVGDFMRRKAIREELSREDRHYDEVIVFTVPPTSAVDTYRPDPASIPQQLQRRYGVRVSYIVVEAGPPNRLVPPATEKLQVRDYASLSQRN